MRGIFSLVGVLVTVGVIAWIMSEAYLPYTKAVINAQKSMQPTINRVTSKGDDGLPSSSSAVLLPIEKNGALRALSVQSIVTGGAMDTAYGLLPGDIILKIQGIPIGDPFTATVTDESSARDFLFVDAYRGHWPLTVDRGGTEITLPAQRGFVPPTSAVPGGTNAPSNPSAPGNPTNSAEDLLKQLEKR